MKKCVLVCLLGTSIFYFTYTYGQKVIFRDMNKSGDNVVINIKAENTTNQQSSVPILSLPDTSNMSARNCIMLNVNDSTKYTRIDTIKLNKILPAWKAASLF